MQEEVWKDIKGFEGIYQVSSLANIRSLDRVEESYRSDFNITVTRYRKGITLKQKLTSTGYNSVHLRDHTNDLEKWPSVHRLVAEAFVPNEDNKPTVNHIDGVKTNNLPVNLEWATSKEQTQHAFDNGLMFVRGNTLYNDDLKEEVKQFHKDTGLSYNKIANHFGFSARTASRIIRGQYGDVRKAPKQTVSTAKWLREQGFTLVRIGEILGYNFSTIHNWVGSQAKE